MPSRVYLDHNAASPLRPEAREAIAMALEIGANPSSVHAPGRAARALIEDARGQVAALAGVSADEIVFTSGATEANNLALKGAAVERRLVSAVEHVSVMAANNETGVVQPIAEIARIAHQAGALFHCDAAQAPGRLALERIVLAADFVSLSSPKIGGPLGVGALVVREGVELSALLVGGGQERRLRAGTENLAGIAGFGAAAQAASNDLGATPRVAALRDRLEAEALSLAAEAVVVGAGAPRLANTSALALPGVPAESQILALDLAGIAVGAGAACSSGKIARSHVLAAMGLSDAIAMATIRVSLASTTTDADIDAFLSAWADLRTRARAHRILNRADMA